MNAESQRRQRDPADIEVTVPYPGDLAERRCRAR
jgi:hypothetical protein